jgi:hypothetical protein
MNNKDTGGPAFPVHPDMAAQLGCVPSSSDAGMSLRDYFAAKAMQGGIDLVPHMATPKVDKTMPQIIAEMAYEYADAMLKAREQ